MTPSSLADTQTPEEIPYRRIINLAWPASVAASITPLLGAVDVWALGQSPNPLAIAAVGLAATIFSIVYWTFGFIRMSVAGLTAQAIGAGDHEQAGFAFIRAFLIGAAIGTVLLLLQIPLSLLAFHLLGLGSAASDATFSAARSYFHIRIWGAPFAIATYACLGWLTARGRTDWLMITGIAMTSINMVLDTVFVLHFDMGAGGIALGTLIAEMAGLIIGLLFVSRLLKKDGLLSTRIDRKRLLNADALRRTFAVNIDIFLRTALLAVSFSWFIQRGSAYGDVTLAANQLLMQLFLFSGLALDGTAIAAETLIGQTLGKRKSPHALMQYNMILKRTFLLALGGALLFATLYALAGNTLLSLLTHNQPIQDTASQFLPWVIISPMMVMVCFQLDGIFVGATKSKEMRNSMLVSALIFLPVSLWLGSILGNHGLWAAFSVFFIVRAITLWRYMPRISQEFNPG